MHLVGIYVTHKKFDRLCRSREKVYLREKAKYLFKLFQ